MLLRNLALLLAGGIVLSACGSSAPDTPRTPSSPSTGQGEQITGRERLGWDQPASDAAELASLRYAIYVDGTRVELTSVSCAATATSVGFACSTALPPLSAGAHTLALAAFILDGSTVLESGRTTPLQVVVVATTTGAPPVNQ
jgi:hypothetical protein